MSQPLVVKKKNKKNLNWRLSSSKTKGNILGGQRSTQVAITDSRMYTGSTVVMGVAPDLVIVLLQLRSVCVSLVWCD